MDWYKWVFDGIGTTIIASICSFISYKAAVKQISKQIQVAGDNSKQEQNMIIENKRDSEDLQNSIKQTQKASSNSKQIQYGEFKDGK